MASRSNPRRICSIYLRDIYTFLRRKKIDECRQVSAHFDTTFTHCVSPKGGWPLLCMGNMYFGSIAGEEAEAAADGEEIETRDLRRRDDGYVDEVGRIQANNLGYSPWHTLDAFQRCHCCDDLREAASKLVGHCIYESRDADEIVYMKALNRGHLVFISVNRLTPETAHGLLHFLVHLSEGYFHLVRLRVPRELRIASHQLINTTITDAIGSTGSFRLKFKCRVLERDCTAMDAYQPFKAETILFSRFSSNQVEQAIYATLNGGRYCRKLKFGPWTARFTSAVVDSIIERIMHNEFGLKKAVATAEFEVHSRDQRPLRPTRIFRSQAELDEAEGNAVVGRVFTTTITGEEFRVEFGPSSRAPLYKLKLSLK